MVLDKVTASQWADRLRTEVLALDDQLDVYFGPLVDGAIRPHAVIYEELNDRVRTLFQLLTLENPDVFAGNLESVLEGRLFDEGILLSAGSFATANLLLERAAVPTSDLPVQRGTPVASSGAEPVVYVTTETRTLELASASSYFNAATGRYELNVPAIALTPGREGQVGANRLTRFLRPLPGFDSVTNPAASSTARGRLSNEEAITLYLLAVRGRVLSTPDGVRFTTREELAAVEDVYVAKPGDALLTRSSLEGQAVDIYLDGEERLTQTETLTYVDVNQVVPVTLPPLVSVSAVVDLSGPTTFVEGADYEVVLDEGAEGRSARAVEGVRFLPGGSAPARGAPIVVTYVYDNLVRRAQALETDDATDVMGRDGLYKRATRKQVVLEARLKPKATASGATTRQVTETRLLDYVNTTLGLGDDVEESDLQGVVRLISGIDNFLIDRLTFDDTPSGVSDLAIANNERPVLDAANLSITLI